MKNKVLYNPHFTLSHETWHRNTTNITTVKKNKTTSPKNPSQKNTMKIIHLPKKITHLFLLLWPVCRGAKTCLLASSFCLARISFCFFLDWGVRCQSGSSPVKAQALDFFLRNRHNSKNIRETLNKMAKDQDATSKLWNARSIIRKHWQATSRTSVPFFKILDHGFPS